MQYYALSQNVCNQEIAGRCSTRNLIRRSNEYVYGELDSEPRPYAGGMLPGFAGVRCNYQEVDIRILSRFPACVGTEQNDLVWPPHCGHLINKAADFILCDHAVEDVSIGSVSQSF